MRFASIVLGTLVSAAAFASAQPALYLNTSNIDFAPSNIYQLQANRPPTTIWFKMLLTNRQYDWKRMAVVGAFSTRLLPTPVIVPGVGTIEVDPSALLHFDPAMATRLVRLRSSTAAEIVAWTVFPRIPSSLIGTRFFGQFIAYEANSSNPRWTTSQAYTNRNDWFAWVVLPG